MIYLAARMSYLAFVLKRMVWRMVIGFFRLFLWTWILQAEKRCNNGMVDKRDSHKKRLPQIPYSYTNSFCSNQSSDSSLASEVPVSCAWCFCDGLDEQLVVGFVRSVGGVFEFLLFGLDYRPQRAADAQS